MKRTVTKRKHFHMMRAGKIRAFCVYGENDVVYGVHAYDKKTQSMPARNIVYAFKVLGSLTAGEPVK